MKRYVVNGSEYALWQYHNVVGWNHDEKVVLVKTTPTSRMQDMLGNTSLMDDIMDIAHIGICSLAFKRAVSLLLCALVSYFTAGPP
jgi:hypothetical protein